MVKVKQAVLGACGVEWSRESEKGLERDLHVDSNLDEMEGGRITQRDEE